MYMFLLITHFPLAYAALAVVCFTCVICFSIRNCSKFISDSFPVGWIFCITLFLCRIPVIGGKVLYIFCHSSFDQVWFGYFWNLTKQILILTYGLEQVWEHMTESYITVSKYVMVVCLKQCCLWSFMVPQSVHTLAGEAFQIRELRDFSHSHNFNSMTVLRNHCLLCSLHESAARINSFCSHSDMFIASSKVGSPRSAIYCFLFQFPVFSLFLREARGGAVGWGTVLFTSGWYHRIFHWHNPSGRTVALGSTQPLTEMSKKVKQSRYRPGGTQRIPGS